MKKALCALTVLTLTTAVPAARADTPKKSNATVGRWLYTGTLPRFDADHLEIFVSKVGLTARVRGWIPSEMPSHYGEYPSL